jgi:hypothetical protein
MKRIMLATALAVGMLFTSSQALAGVRGAHFVSVSVQKVGDQLELIGKVAGLGDVEQINVLITADVACINPGSHHPKAENKEGISFGAVVPVQNGRAEFDLLTTDPNIQPPCDPPMTLQYSNVVVLVTTDDGLVRLEFDATGTF